MHRFILPMAVGICAGMVTRILLTQTSYRQFPSKPHGMIIHFFLGFVASLLGSLIVPAVLKPDFTAGVFISIGTAQFHSMRNLEREAWKNLDKGEAVPRGGAFIEGMGVAFEARIFLVIAVSAISTLIGHLVNWPTGLCIGIVLSVLLRFWRQGKCVGDLATVEMENVRIQDDGIYVTSYRVARWDAANPAILAEELLAVVVKPKNLSAVLTFAHNGQQQTILHNLAVHVGVQTHPTLKPTVVYYPKDGVMILLILPVIHHAELACKAVSGAPILEAVYRKVPVPV